MWFEDISLSGFSPESVGKMVAETAAAEIDHKQLEQLERCILKIPPAASWLPILLSHIGSQVKRRQSQSYKIKEFAKITKFWISKQTLHATHHLKLLGKMCKYEMDPKNIVEETKRTWFCPQMDRRTDRRMDRQGETSGGLISLLVTWGDFIN